MLRKRLTLIDTLSLNYAPLEEETVVNEHPAVTAFRAKLAEDGTLAPDMQALVVSLLVEVLASMDTEIDPLLEETGAPETAGMSILSAMQIALEGEEVPLTEEPAEELPAPAKETISQYVEMVIGKLRETLSYQVLESVEPIVRAVVNAALEAAAQAATFDVEVIAESIRNALVEVSGQETNPIPDAHLDLIVAGVKSALVEIQTIMQVTSAATTEVA